MGEASRKFRELLTTEPYVFTSGLYTPLQARIAEMVGLKCVYLSGYCCSLGYLGRADLGFPTMTEMTGWARYVAGAVSIPVIADADDGYGNALITMRTIEEYEKTGVAGIHLEDQRLPKRCGHLAGKTVIPRDEAVKKFKAAVAAKSDPDFFIIARTDAEGVAGGSLGEAIERSKAYANVGVDMVWAEFSIPDRRSAEAFAEALKKDFPNLPLAFDYASSFNWTKVENPLTFQALGEMGYKYIFISMGTLHAATYAEWNFLNDLKENEEQAQLRLQRTKEGHPTENHHTMGRFDYFTELEEEYLPEDVIRERYR